VIIIPNVGRTDQQRLFRAVIEKLFRLGEPVNRVLEVDIEGGDATFTLYDLPGDPADPGPG
jgi:hypothetical protein